jgi:carbamoyl-phosphate synthase large subunit
MKRRTSVLVTAIGSTTAQSVVKGLRKQRERPVRVIGTDTHKERETTGQLYCNRFVTVPPASEVSDYVRALRRIVKDEDVRLLVPIHDRELAVLARHRTAFLDSCLVLVSPFDSVQICNDKWRTYQALTKWKIPTFRTMLPDLGRPLADQVRAEGFRYPLIAKPRDGVSSRGLQDILGPEDLVLLKRVMNPILQEKRDGPEFTIDTFSNRNGVLAIVPRLRIETRSGISYRGRTMHDSGLERLAGELVERLRILGPANVQVIRTSEGDRVVEINPRFSGGLPLTIASGVNTPLMALRMAWGEKLRRIGSFRAVTMCRRWEEVFYFGA